LIVVTVRENEPFEKALRRFRRKVEREGIRKDIKKNSFYLKPGEKRRLKQRLAEKRRRKAARRAVRGPGAPAPAAARSERGGDRGE
jgi:small subunit ribosomal protein S21